MLSAMSDWQTFVSPSITRRRPHTNKHFAHDAHSSTFSLSHLQPPVTMLSLLIMYPLCSCPTANSDGARAAIVPGPVYQATVQPYHNEPFHDVKPAAVPDAMKEIPKVS